VPQNNGWLLSQRSIVIISKRVYSDALEPILLLWTISIPSSFSDSPFFRATWTRGSEAVTATAMVTEALCAEIKEEKATNIRFSYEKQNDQQNSPFSPSLRLLHCWLLHPDGSGKGACGFWRTVWHELSSSYCNLTRRTPTEMENQWKEKDKREEDGIVHKQITHPSHLLVPQHKTEQMCLTFKGALEEERWVGR